MFSMGTSELVVVMFVALLLFGSRLPDVAKSLGRGVFEFKKGLNGIDDPASKLEQSNKSKGTGQD